MTKKRIIYLILLISWMLVIFNFSNQNGDTSLGLSDNVTEKAIDIKNSITHQEISTKEKKQKILDYRYVVRKIAHFTEFCILGILVFLNLKNYKLKHIILWSTIFCLIYAGSDELHQYFAYERDARIMDILIDTFGGIFGIIIIYLVANNKKNVIINKARRGVSNGRN